MANNLDMPFLASRLFGVPLMLASTKLDIILNALAPRLFAGEKLDVCIHDIGGLPPKSQDRVVVISPKNTSQEHFVITEVQASESGMYKLILRELK
uniref:hypothetical protein n=1 Tax=Bartonella raoultii TaxID=1457020 RepID=UPI001FEDBEB3|nr:hypothetical protein [Bartonella raoultii]